MSCAALFGVCRFGPLCVVPTQRNALRRRWLQLLAHSFFMPFALTCCATIASGRPLIEGRGSIATSSRDFHPEDNNSNSSNSGTRDRSYE